MRTILRLRDPSRPEPEPTMILECWPEMQRAGVIQIMARNHNPNRLSGENILVSISIRGTARHPSLPKSWGFPLDDEGRLVDCTADAKSEVFDELLAACKFVQEHCPFYGPSDRAREMLTSAIANADALTASSE